MRCAVLVVFGVLFVVCCLMFGVRCLCVVRLFFGCSLLFAVCRLLAVDRRVVTVVVRCLPSVV